jgi:hypothetical protein
MRLEGIKGHTPDAATLRERLFSLFIIVMFYVIVLCAGVPTPSKCYVTTDIHAARACYASALSHRAQDHNRSVLSDVIDTQRTVPAPLTHTISKPRRKVLAEDYLSQAFVVLVDTPA